MEINDENTKNRLHKCLTGYLWHLVKNIIHSNLDYINISQENFEKYDKTYYTIQDCVEEIEWIIKNKDIHIQKIFVKIYLNDYYELINEWIEKIFDVYDTEIKFREERMSIKEKVIDNVLMTVQSFIGLFDHYNAHTRSGWKWSNNMPLKVINVYPSQMIENLKSMQKDLNVQIYKQSINNTRYKQKKLDVFRSEFENEKEEMTTTLHEEFYLHMEELRKEFEEEIAQEQHKTLMITKNEIEKLKEKMQMEVIFNIEREKEKMRADLRHEMEKEKEKMRTELKVEMEKEREKMRMEVLLEIEKEKLRTKMEIEMENEKNKLRQSFQTDIDDASSIISQTTTNSWDYVAK